MKIVEGQVGPMDTRSPILWTLWTDKKMEGDHPAILIIDPPEGARAAIEKMMGQARLDSYLKKREVDSPSNPEYTGEGAQPRGQSTPSPAGSAMPPGIETGAIKIEGIE